VQELKKVCNHPFLTNGAEQQYNDTSDPLGSLIRNSGKLVRSLVSLEYCFSFLIPSSDVAG
jgi:hypothetical protein